MGQTPTSRSQGQKYWYPRKGLIHVKYQKMYHCSCFWGDWFLLNFLFHFYLAIWYIEQSTTTVIPTINQVVKEWINWLELLKFIWKRSSLSGSIWMQESSWISFIKRIRTRKNNYCMKSTYVFVQKIFIVKSSPLTEML